MITNFVALLSALIIVESGGNDKAIGDSGLAAGCLQIHSGVVQDVNRVYKTTYKWPDSCFDRNISIDIWDKYLAIYATPKRLGHEPTFEDCARIWNGGPMGFTNKNTIKYWNRVKKQIDNNNQKP